MLEIVVGRGVVSKSRIIFCSETWSGSFHACKTFNHIFGHSPKERNGKWDFIARFRSRDPSNGGGQVLSENYVAEVK
jgi:hypothetical protein